MCLLIHLCLPWYVSLKFELLKSLHSYWTFCYLHHDGFPLRKRAQSSLDRSLHTSLPALGAVCHSLLSTVKASDQLISDLFPVQQYTGSWRSTNTVYKNGTQSPSLPTEGLGRGIKRVAPEVWKSYIKKRVKYF